MTREEIEKIEKAALAATLDPWKMYSPPPTSILQLCAIAKKHIKSGEQAAPGPSKPFEAGGTGF